MTAAGNTSAALVAQLAEVWGSISELADELADDEWRRPTACPGWSVQDQMVHILAAEQGLLGGQPDRAEVSPEPDYVHNDIGWLNEAVVAAWRPRPPAEAVAEFRRVTTERLAALRARDEPAWAEAAWTAIGQQTYRRAMQIRVFDCWVHEQDMRRAVGRPGGGAGPAAEQSFDEIERALGYIVGKRAGAPEGSAVTIELTGPVTRTMHVSVTGGRAAVVDALPGRPDVIVRLDSATFAALACGRQDPAAACPTIEGDTALGERIVAHLAFTI